MLLTGPNAGVCWSIIRVCANPVNVLIKKDSSRFAKFGVFRPLNTQMW